MRRQHDKMLRALTTLVSVICLSAIHVSSSFVIGNTNTCSIPNLQPKLIPSSLKGYLDNLDNPQSHPSTEHIDKQSKEKEEEDNDVDSKLKAARFSKFAPDANALDANDFRSQLKENMKADLERRRAEDPNRGNQPTRNYLEGL